MEAEIYKIIINKNRGWRGLAEARCLDNEGKEITKMIFSFSQPMWDDMLAGYIVIQDTDNYYVLRFDNTDALPKGQRSVLLKYFTANVLNVYSYPKNDWSQPAIANGHWNYIHDFVKNRNNHTTSDWNCVGIRVLPMI